ncbi:hypothetical protein AVEN_171254-1 [Araneus ventricosus]|uniref:Uncharacterized protein n=1 Tax=Araneus ventricosus TaxID=182803 RepID=A0A4Y2GYS1_ARAVE|nr:hypothetical protein AVEN_171254-1 [Araneus ventricosus]
MAFDFREPEGQITRWIKEDCKNMTSKSSTAREPLTEMQMRSLETLFLQLRDAWSSGLGSRHNRRSAIRPILEEIQKIDHLGKKSLGKALQQNDIGLFGTPYTLRMVFYIVSGVTMEFLSLATNSPESRIQVLQRLMTAQVEGHFGVIETLSKTRANSIGIDFAPTSKMNCRECHARAKKGPKSKN